MTVKKCDDCPRCRHLTFHFQSVIALGVYQGDLRESVLRMKQSLHEPLAVAMGHLLAQRIEESVSSPAADLIVPVPMHWSRRVFRGMNPAELMAGSISVELRTPTLENLLTCRRKTKKQGTLGPHERMRNVRGAFGVSSRYDIRGAKLLLVDDVMTTAATGNEVSKVCRKAGAASVFVAVVARGIGVD